MRGPGHRTLPEDAQRARVARRREGKLAGLLFIACPLASVPSSLLIEPTPPGEIYLVGVASILVGVVCLTLPWERMNRLWLHALGVFATVAVSIAIGLADDTYVFFYFFIAVLAAYVARNRDELAVQLGVISLGVLSPLLYQSGATADDTVQLALLAIPALAITSGLVFHLRARLEAERLAYRSFAEEALALTSRIRGVELEPLPALPAEPRDFIDRGLAGRWRVPALAAVGVLLGVPLLTAGLAAAGVGLPQVVREPYERLGIELPNQTGDGAEEPEPASIRPLPASPPASADGDAPAERDDGERADREKEGGASSASGRQGSAEPGPAGAANEPAAEVSVDPAEPATPTPSTPAPTPPVDPGATLRDTLDERLRDTIDDVNQLLDGLNLSQ